MSIPLDRLYHYIESLNGDVSTIIYRFFPHGSKKLEDLKPLSGTAYQQGWFYNMTTPYMICHDQEPLDYNLYSFEDCVEHTLKIRSPEWTKSDYYVKTTADMHLRSTVFAPANCYDFTILTHSEKNSQELNNYEQNGFVGVYWWSHAVIARDWFRYAEHDQLLIPNFNNITKDFLIYNRAWGGTREYRLKFVELLQDNELINCCQTTFATKDSGHHYKTHQFLNSDLSIRENANFEPLFVNNTADATASADYNASDYKTIAIEVVLETLFDDLRQHLTEKTLRPIACGRPFIIVATPGSLQYLRDYGFQTFANFINEDYDLEIDPVKRLCMIIKEMRRISDLSVESKKQLWNNLYAIAKYNQQLFFSAKWQEKIAQEYQNNFKTAMNFMNKNCTGKYWRTIRQQAEFDDYIKSLISKDSPFRTQQDVQQLTKWLEQHQ